MDPLLALIGGVPDDQERQRQIAQNLRRDRDFGTLFTMTGDEALSQAGRDMFGDTADMAYRAGAGRRTDEYNQMMREKYAADRDMAERKQSALEKWKQKELAIKEQKADQKDYTRIPKTDREAFAGYGETLYGLDRTLKSLEDPEFDPGGMSVPGMNTGLNWAVGTLGMGTDERDKIQQWWQTYDQIYTLPVRNKMFGATLTEGEKAAWNAAHISQEMSKEMIEERLATMKEIMRRARDREFAGVQQEGFFNPDAVRTYMGYEDETLPDPDSYGDVEKPREPIPDMIAAPPPASAPGQAPAGPPQQQAPAQPEPSENDAGRIQAGDIVYDDEGNAYRFLGGDRYDMKNYEQAGDINL